MWVLPSYGRPAQCQWLLDQMVSRGMQAPGFVAVNEDDPRHGEYQQMEFPRDWGLMTLPAGTVGFGEACREIFRAFPDMPWYGVICDDNSVETTGFEAALVDAATAWGIASGNDCWQAREDVREGRMQGAIVFGGELVRALGYLVPDGFDHLYIDNMWEHLGRSLGVWKTLMSTLTPHNHPIKTGEEMDVTTARVNRPEQYRKDKARLLSWLRTEAPDDIARVRKAMGIHGPDIATAKTRSVLICTPCARSPVLDYTASVLATAAVLDSLNIRWDAKFLCGWPINQARNELVAQFRQTDFTDLLFIDDDMGWSPDDVLRLLGSERELIAGVGKKRRPGPDADVAMWCFAGLPGDGAVPEDERGNIEVEHVGTGFMRIRREVFDALEEAHPAWRRRTGPTAFFANDVENGVELSEDITFCHRWRRIGGRVWVDPNIQLRHNGNTAFQGNFRSLFRIEQPTAG